MKMKTAILRLLPLIAGSLSIGWTFSGGPVYRGGMEAEVSGSSYSQQGAGLAGIPGAYNRYSTVSAPEDDITESKPRTFDDGFIDISTPTVAGIPFLMIPPNQVTIYWGFQQAAQVDAANGKLVFTRVSSASENGRASKVSSEVTKDAAADAREDMEGIGFRLEARKELFAKDKVTGSALFQLLGIPGLQQDVETSTYEAMIEQRLYRVRSAGVFTETYVYDDTYNVLPSVMAPFSGTPSSPGPLFSYNPESRSVASSGGGASFQQTGVNRWTRFNMLKFDIEADHFALMGGGRIDVALTDVLGLFVSPQVGVHFIDVDVTRTEALVSRDDSGAEETLNSWTDTASESAAELGFGLDAGVVLEAASGWFIEISGGYDWLTDTVEIDVGPNRVALDLDAYEAGISVGKTL